MLSANASETVSSPDGRLNFTFTQSDDKLLYSVQRDGKDIISQSRLGVAIENKLFEAALGVSNEAPRYWGDGWCGNLRVKEVTRCSVDMTWTPLYGEWATIPDKYNEMTIHMLKGTEEQRNEGGYDKAKCYYMNIKVRAYNEGIAFCYEFPETSNGLFVHLTDELTEFKVDQRAKVWATEWAQGRFLSPDLAKPLDAQLERPLTMRLPDGTALSLLEARLVDYARTKFSLKGNGVIKAQPYSSVDFMTPFATSWRLIMVADNMPELCNHDYMVLNLNDRQDDSFEWVKPGKVFRSQLSKKELFEAVDFASARGLQYIHLDAGWYGPEVKMSSSALAVSEKRDFTIPEIVEYAKSKGIGVFVYVNQRALYQQLDSILPLYEKWGIKGIKFGFVQVGNQQWTNWLHQAIRKCAEHKLMVDIHDEYRPTGYSRTYPNLMTTEGIAGNEEMPDATHNVTLPFTRFLCGPADYTLCYFNGRVQGTRAHQLAMAAVYYSPLTWMYWYDRPNAYHGESELEFWEKIPTVWRDTRVLQGNPDEYIVTARQADNGQWFVGAMTGEEQRSVTLPLTFLQKDKKYIAHIYEDDPANVPNNKKQKDQTLKVNVTLKNVTSKTSLTLPLLPSGGAAVWIEEK